MSSKSSEGAWSITARLIALFTISASTLLLLVVAIMYYAIAQHLDEEHEHLLAEIGRVMQQAASSRERNVATLVDDLGRIAADEPASYSDPYSLRVLDEHNAVLAESRGMSAIPVTAFSRPSMSSERVHAKRWSAPNGDAFLLATLHADRSGVGRAGTVVQVALNVTRDRTLMRQLRLTAIILLVLSLLAAAVAGAAVVRHSLRPLEQIATEVADISAEQLQRRLSAEARPRELAGLVRAFNSVLDRLDRAFAGLSQFSANLAHELRTPLNNLQGEAEVALLQQRRPEEYREVLMSSLEEYERLSKMIDGLLFLARAESHETKPAWSVLLLADEARAVCDFYAALADDKKVVLSVEGDASAEVDPVLVRRALGNLISNSLRHVSAGCHVTVAIAQSDDGHATVRVIDDGRGIAALDLPKVLDRFYRGSASRSDGGGSGLGLAIVKSIMDLHGGTIDVASAVDRGTTVTLQFPRAHQS
jgi:two-component system heavy metal sensor histidine kinase CusS